jgi:hypothetical protein
MVKRLNRFLDHLAKRRSDRRANRAERALRRNKAKALRLRHERFDDKGGPLGGGGI